MSRKLARPVLVWEHRPPKEQFHFRIVQVREDNGYRDAGMYVVECSTCRDAMGDTVWHEYEVDVGDVEDAADPFLRAVARALRSLSKREVVA